MSEVVCHRCGRLLVPGDEPPMYVVRIEAIADPTPPTMSAEQSDVELRAAWEALLQEMEEMSERELLDQVHRVLTLHLCSACYALWIEDPTGSIRGA